MKSLKTTLKLLAVVVPICALGVLSAPEASAQYGYRPPPAAYVASYRPVYYNGMPHYWYGGRWFYRQGGAWRWYEHEPAGLARYRVGWEGNHYHWRR